MHGSFAICSNFKIQKEDTSKLEGCDSYFEVNISCNYLVNSMCDMSSQRVSGQYLYTLQTYKYTCILMQCASLF